MCSRPELTPEITQKVKFFENILGAGSLYVDVEPTVFTRFYMSKARRDKMFALLKKDDPGYTVKTLNMLSYVPLDISKYCEPGRNYVIQIHCI